MSNEWKQQPSKTFARIPAAQPAYDHASAATHHSSLISHHSPLITHHASLSDDYKQRAREQWSANPCGASVARDQEFGTREYFDAIEKHRYEIACPWIKQAIGFDHYEGQRLLEVGFGTGTDLEQAL